MHLTLGEAQRVISFIPLNTKLCLPPWQYDVYLVELAPTSMISTGLFF